MFATSLTISTDEISCHDEMVIEIHIPYNSIDIYFLEISNNMQQAGWVKLRYCHFGFFSDVTSGSLLKSLNLHSKNNKNDTCL